MTQALRLLVVEWVSRKFSEQGNLLCFQVDVSSGLDGQKSDPASRFSNVFNITILPMNDQEFTVQTKFPELKLVQGFTANITRDHLLTTDPDTPPEGLTYQIVNPPNNGYIVMASDPDVPIDAFTQRDINEQKVLFIQDGSMESGAFYLRISDGKFDPFFKVVNVLVQPLTLELVNTSDIKIEQGRSSTFVTVDNFGVVTNGRVSKVIYNITAPPMFGQLYMHDSMVYQFSHQNVEDGKVTYIQTDLSSYWDSFEFILYDSQNMLTNQKINITVVPKVKQNPASAPGGEELVLTTNDLDAGELASITGSNPNYTILADPKYGKLVRIQPGRVKRHVDLLVVEKLYRHHKDKRDTHKRKTKRESKRKKVKSFTHQDIVEGLIKYVPNRDGPDREMKDSFTYLLTADNVQPAKGVYHINIVPSKAEPTDGGEEGEGQSIVPKTAKPEKTTEGYTPPTIGSNKEVNDQKTRISRDHLIIIILVSAVTVIAILVLIITKCLRRRRRQKQLQQMEAAKEDSRTPLAHAQPPHMQIEPSDRPLPTHEEGSEEDSERSAMLNGGPRIPKINITSDSASGSLPGSQSRSRSPSPSRQGESRLHQVEATPRDPGLPPKHAGKQKQPSPQASIEDYSDRTVPLCKVTPLPDDEDAELKTPGGTMKRQVKFDWESIDPELLQHCRTTNPVLHENKYWV